MQKCVVLTSSCLFRIEIDTKLPIVGDQKWVIWICSFNVPMAPGKTRSIVCSARNFFQLTMPGPAWWQVKLLSSCSLNRSDMIEVVNRYMAYFLVMYIVDCCFRDQILRTIIAH